MAAATLLAMLQAVTTERRERVETFFLPDGRPMRARIWDGDGPPLVLLHGVLSSAATWRPLARATSRHCIALDLPGFGGSSAVKAARLESYGDDVIAALHALGVRRCTLVGHSFGGAVATAVAGRGGPVDELVLLAPGGHGDCALARLALDPALGAVASAFVPALACSSTFASRATAIEEPNRRRRLRLLASELRRAATGAVANGRMAVRANEREIAHGDAARACAQRFSGRVTIVWGADDRVLPVAQSDVVRRALPEAELHVLAGTGHALHRERPDEIVGLIGRLDQTGSAT